MKYAILTLVFFLAFSHSCFCQSGQQRIEHIKRVCNTIDSEKHFIVKTLENEEYQEHETDGGGELKGYYKNDSLFEITCWTGISSGVIKDYYYFDKDSLVFVLEQQERFNLTDTSPKNHYKTKRGFEGRYYFYNGQVIAILKKGNPFSSVSDLSNNDFVTLLKEEAKKYLQLLASRGHKELH